MKLRKNPYKEVVKEATNFSPWDYGYVLGLEKTALEYMLKAFTSNKVWSDQSNNIRYIKLALKCIDIVENNDNAHILEYEPIAFGTTSEKIDFPKKNKDFMIKYVNCKNFKRFMPMLKPEDFDENIFKNELRIRKAWHLYNLIRSYHMLAWWD